jgi:hypothetical protein
MMPGIPSAVGPSLGSLCPVILALIAVGRLGSAGPPGVPIPWQDLEALGAPTRYFVDVEPYRFAMTDVRKPASYPIPRDPVTRQMVTFEETFPARVSPLWNTHNIGLQLGSHRADLFIRQPVGENGTRSTKTAPADLLSRVAPHAQDGSAKPSESLLSMPMRHPFPPRTPLLAAVLLTTLSASAEPAAIVVTGESQAPGRNVERIGPPTFYAPPIERYRVGAPDVNNPAYYPIPKTAVTRVTYMAWLEQSGLLDYAKQPRLGMSGPTLLLPSLAKYVQTGERHWGEACIAMLKDYRRALEAEVNAKGWVEQFAEPPAFLPVYRKHLIAGGLMTPDGPWFRELWLYYCRNLHVWGTKPIEWRGPCHRSMSAALAGASAIQVVRDDLDATVLRLEFEPGRVEWIVFNPQTVPIQAAGLETSAPLAYIGAGGP